MKKKAFEEITVLSWLLKQRSLTHRPRCFAVVITLQQYKESKGQNPVTSPMDRTHQSESTTRPENTVVLSIDCLKGSSKSEEWSGDMLQTGDIVEEIRIGSGPGSAIFKAPFKGGKAWLQKIVVRVRRGSEDLSDLSACIVPNESAGKRQYMLRSIDDPNYTVGFSDRTESVCLGIQGEFTRSVNYLFGSCVDFSGLLFEFCLRHRT
ncbi:hypothetical protein YC2023_107547 [Brassica napus]